MTPMIGSGESPFNLAFSTKSILSPEIVFPSPRVESLDKETSKERLRARFDPINEVRVEAHLYVLRYNRAVAMLYDR